MRGLWAWGRLNLTVQFPALIKKKQNGGRRCPPMGHLKSIITAASFGATGSSHPPYHVVHPRGRGPKQCPHTWRPGGAI